MNEKDRFDKEIEEYRKQYSPLSRSQLIAEMLQVVPDCPQHIASRQLLDEMEIKESNQTIKIARRANHWAFWAFIMGLLSLLAAVAFWTYDHVHLLYEPAQKTEKLTLKPEPPPSSKDTFPFPSEPLKQSHRPLSQATQKNK